MSDSTITFVIIGFVVVLFVSNRVPVGIVALGTSIALWATGVLELDEATAGFGDPAVLFIASLFVVSEALDSTGVTAWVGQQLIDRAGASRTKIVAYVMVACALLTALVTPNASVAALVPVVVIIAVRVGQHTSQLLMPLAFAAHAGALLALTGSPVSVLVSQSAEEAGLGRFGFFEFALTGIPLLLGTVLIVIVGGRRLLPHRSPSSLPPDLHRPRVGPAAAVLRRRPASRAAVRAPLRGSRTRRAAEVAGHRGAPGAGHADPRWSVERRVGPTRRDPGGRRGVGGRRCRAGQGHVAGAEP